MSRTIYAWVLNGHPYCHNPYGGKQVTEYSQEEVIREIQAGRLPNECCACGLPLVSQEDLQGYCKVYLTVGSES